eukprot:1161761-Pelagomonas_calceolata.AAC.1
MTAQTTPLTARAPTRPCPPSSAAQAGHTHGLCPAGCRAPGGPASAPAPAPGTAQAAGNESKTMGATVEWWQGVGLQVNEAHGSASQHSTGCSAKPAGCLAYRGRGTP